MNENTKPEFKDIVNLIDGLPIYQEFKNDVTDPIEHIKTWLAHNSRTLDFTRGFNVNRTALYWAGYNAVDGFDGQAFVDSCQDSKGTLRSLSEILDTDLQIFELDPHNTSQPDSDAIALATSYGMMAIEEGTQLFSACSFGKGVNIASTETLNKINTFQDLETFMTNNCGLDIAAMLGAAIACIMKGIPMILEGPSGELVMALLEKSTGRQFSNLILSPITISDIPGHNMMTTAIMMKTLYAGLPKTDCGKIKLAA